MAVEDVGVDERGVYVGEQIFEVLSCVVVFKLEHLGLGQAEEDSGGALICDVVKAFQGQEAKGLVEEEFGEFDIDIVLLCLREPHVIECGGAFDVISFWLDLGLSVSLSGRLSLLLLNDMRSWFP